MSNEQITNPELALDGKSATADLPQDKLVQEKVYAESMRAVVMGEVMSEWPQDLFIPPDALEVVLESFEGPLDLLLYLIRKQNLDILNIPVADITRQYMAYVEIMRAANLDLAAEYLVMAALLGEIKSRMLLPRPKAEQDDDEDPMSALVRRLQEYERFSLAANQLDDRPRLDRDIFSAQAVFDDPNPPEVRAQVSLEQLVKAFQSVVDRADVNQNMRVSRDMLSMRERMTSILSRLQTQDYLRFEELFTQAEGRLGVVVTFIALLELFRDDMLVVVQTEPLAPIHIKRAA
ncbi:segregation and condensation protein A [Arenicella xantha]|uniref:Segregation and condensation protein A n=1 Tax=Arenicella xantha TaxID=644221 RepID=A0A395JL67_9GAMM|nr:segregation/condensation protein A [Arenicella xantha]RBP51512.1 condensin subunit ScpA [Arenicella xantha]